MLSSEQTAYITGFGMISGADGYLHRPVSIDQIFETFRTARETGRQVVLRGAGRSYGDASIAPEALILDCGRMDQVRRWNPTTGLITCGPGVTVEKLWRTVIEDGYWPPVVSGTMFPTLAGALAMNIHGKNAFREGTLGEHIQSITLATPNGQVITLAPDDQRFFTVISGAGLHGAITEITLQLKKVPSGLLNVLPVSVRDWDHHFRLFRDHEATADYMVGWVDCLTTGGRGEFHAAWYMDAPAHTFRPQNQDLPDTLLGVFPKSALWRFMKPLNTRFGMRRINSAKYQARRLKGDQVTHPQSLVGFSFLLDYVPGWRNSYLPDGFIQYQSFVPKESAQKVFERQVAMQHDAGIPAFLGVLKRHRPDNFNFSHGVDGYSLALDIKVTSGNWDRIRSLCHRMNDLVLEHGGRFYLAKDSTLRPDDFAQSVGPKAIDRFQQCKAQMDPENLLTSSLAKRLNLDPEESRPCQK